MCVCGGGGVGVGVGGWVGGGWGGGGGGGGGGVGGVAMCASEVTLSAVDNCLLLNHNKIQRVKGVHYFLGCNIFCNV